MARALEALVDRRFDDEHAGRLILWHGMPGTGKTHALRALAWEWRRWCDFHYVTDPEELFDAPVALLPLESLRLAATMGHQLHDCMEVLLDGELAEDAGILGKVSQAKPGSLEHGHVRDVDPVETNRTVQRFDHAGDHPKGGRFAGSVGPQETDDLALVHVEIDAIDDRSFAVLFGKPSNLK